MRLMTVRVRKRDVGRARVAVLVAALVALGLGCSRVAAYEQVFALHVTRGINAAPNIRVRLLSGPSVTCESTGVEGVTDSRGAVLLRQRYQPAGVERFVVRVHLYKVCVMQEQAWLPIWSLTTGPAPARMDLECELGSVPATCRTVAGPGRT